VSVFTSEDYQKFRVLRVTHIATMLEALIADEDNDALTPEQLFLTAVDNALEARRAARIAKLITAAGFPIPAASIAEIDYRDGRGLTPVRMARYAATDWSADHLNTVITSPSGGGKTYIACAIGIAACTHDHTVAYERMDNLARRLTIARADVIAHAKIITDLSGVDLLIIDDFLTVGIDEQAGADLFTILANRNERLSTMIASQTGPAHWVETLPDRVAGDSIVNRLANHARVLDLGGLDMRQVRNTEARAETGYWQ
jgi:DNA replication protein DnaC